MITDKETKTDGNLPIFSVSGSKLDRIKHMKELCEKGLIRFDHKAAKKTEVLIMGCDFGSGKDESRNYIYYR